MEERKKEEVRNKSAKDTPEVEQPKRLSYDQIVQIANQLQERNRQLMGQLQNLSNVYKRLDCLFMVLKNAECFDKTFIKKCADEVQEIMTIPEDIPEQPKKEESPKKD